MAAVIKIEINSAAGGKGIDDTTKALKDLDNTAGNSKGINGFSEMAVGAFREVGAMAVTALGSAAQAMGGFVKDAVTAAGDFEGGMNLFASASGLSGDKLAQFGDLFITLGKELPVSTKEVEDAAIAMVKGGIDPAIVQGGALRDTLLFAASAGMGLADAADLSAKQLATFVDVAAPAAEKTKFLADAQDLLTKAANASTLDVKTLGDALLGAGGQARAMNLSYADFVTTMGAISGSFSSAAEEGTSFKNFLVRLIPKTKPAIDAMKELGLVAKDGSNAFFDAQGNYIGGAKAAGLLKKAFEGLNPQQRTSYLQTIFGNDAMGAANALLGLGEEGFNKFADSMANANGIQATAANTQQGYNFAMQNFGGSVEALQIILGTKLLPLLTPLVTMFTGWLNSVIAFTDTFLKLAPAIMESTNPINTFFNILRIATDDSWNPLIAQMQTFVGTLKDVLIPLLQGDFATVWGMFTQRTRETGMMIAMQIDAWMPMIQEKLTGIYMMAKNQVDQWIHLFGEWVLLAMPGMGVNLALFVQNLYTLIGTALPPLIAQLATWGAAFVAWLTQAIPPLLVQAGAFLASMLAWLGANLPAIMAQLAQWTGQFALWLLHAIPPLIAAAGVLLAQLVSWIITSLPGLGRTLETWGKAFVSWIVAAWPGMLAAFNNLDREFTGWLRGLAQRATADQSVGKAIIDGMVNGINAAIGSLASAAAHAAQAALKAAQDAIHIGSPSKDFADFVGKPMAQGMAMGMTDNVGLVTGAAQHLAGGALQSATHTVNNHYNYSPNYSSIPNKPSEDFGLMKSLAMAGT